MNDLELTRKKINDIDTAMARLFEERMHACESVAAYKKERGLSVKDEARETAMIEKNCRLITDETVASYYVNFLKNTIDLSCRYQTRLMNGMQVAYCGVAGAYAYMAAQEFFPDAGLVACKNFTEAYRSVQDGLYDCAVLPIENSYAGEVGEVMDLLFSGDLYVNQVLEMPIRHQLLTLPGADISNIRTVISHPQALEQCAKKIREGDWQTESCTNTAVAAKRVAEGNDPTVAAIASKETARLFGLTVAAENINDRPDNITRFVAVSRVANRRFSEAIRGNENFILVFTVQNKAGALAQALNIIGAHGFNMRTLRSRPMKNLQWRYYFYVEAEGNIHTPDGEALLRELSAVCARLKTVGTYQTKNDESGGTVS